MKCIRTCIACRKKDKKDNYIRIVKVDDKPVVDNKMKINARGIYICKDIECIRKLLKTKNLSKVVKNRIKVDDLKRLLIEMEDMQIGKN